MTETATTLTDDEKMKAALIQPVHDRSARDFAAYKLEVNYRSKMLPAAYRYCRDLNRAHYENFPVASILFPRKIRPAVDAIYAFARLADDFADEARFSGQRLERLKEWENFLAEREPTHPVFIALQDARKKFDIPESLLQDLLKAFTQDVKINRYLNFNDVVKYCQHSANPVGRLILHLTGYAKPELLEMSDAVCTALQLANFWQDVGLDLEKGRIYLPQDEMRRFGVSEPELFRRHYGENFIQLMRFQVERVREFFKRGHELGLAIPGRLGLELRLTWLTGSLILNKIESVSYDVFRKRPTLSKKDFLMMFFVALNRREYARCGR